MHKRRNLNGQQILSRSKPILTMSGVLSPPVATSGLRTPDIVRMIKTEITQKHVCQKPRRISKEKKTCNKLESRILHKNQE